MHLQKLLNQKLFFCWHLEDAFTVLRIRNRIRKYPKLFPDQIRNWKKRLETDSNPDPKPDSNPDPKPDSNPDQKYICEKEKVVSYNNYFTYSVSRKNLIRVTGRRITGTRCTFTIGHCCRSETFNLDSVSDPDPAKSEFRIRNRIRIRIRNVYFGTGLETGQNYLFN
jgi:hypothetical protein